MPFIGFPPDKSFPTSLLFSSHFKLQMLLHLLSSPISYTHITNKGKMQLEGAGGEEELLTLGLSLNSSWSPKPTNKRKSKDDDDGDDDHHQPNANATNKLLITLFKTRETMLQQQQHDHGIEDGKGLHLVHLLLASATALDTGNAASACDSLTELYRSVSLTGDPIQWVTAYFADGLAARLLTRAASPLHDTIVSNPTQEEEFSAYTHLYRASPYYQFAHFTANQAIIEEFEEEEKKKKKNDSRGLHVIDFDVSYGFQWPSLIQSLSDKAATSNNSPVSLRITGLGNDRDQLKETELRLTNFAEGYCRNLLFEFKGILLRGCTLKPSKIEVRKHETLVVNLVFYLQSLRSSGEIAATLSSVGLLNPSLVVLVEKEGSCCRPPRSFLSRFTESLHYFAAMFDSLDDCLPAESAERLSIEKNHLGREIRKAVTGEEGCYNKDSGSSSSNKCYYYYERPESWKERMERSGFRGVGLSSRSVSQAKLLLRINSHCASTGGEYGNAGGGGFRILERDEGRGLSLGWQDRNLITATAWRCSSAL